MKKKTTVVINGNKGTYIKEKIIAIVILLIAFIVMLTFTLMSFITNKVFAEEINEFAELNTKTVFSVDKIYMYSSADAVRNDETRAVWNLNIYQYTDIAVYINNKSDTELNYENSIKEMYIDNVKFSNIGSGTPSLYFADVNSFGKMSIDENNLIKDKLAYKVFNDGDIDYSKPQIYADCSNPVTLEYVNSNIKENEIISDISSDLTYNGELLRKTGVILNSISGTMTFNITIINYYNQKFVATVYIDIPLEDTKTGATIYDGKFVKKIEGTNITKFFRME